MILALSRSDTAAPRDLIQTTDLEALSPADGSLGTADQQERNPSDCE
jgi:hypothetical protein